MEGFIHFKTASDLAGMQDASALRIQHVQVGLVGGQAADLCVDPAAKRGIKIQALYAFQGIQRALGLFPEFIQLWRRVCFFSFPKVDQNRLPFIRCREGVVALTALHAGIFGLQHISVIL